MRTVRRGRPDDLARLRTIQARTLAEPWPALLETAVEGQPPVYVVVTDRPVGYAIALTDGERVVYVPEIAVHPDHQGEGHGTALLAHLADTYAEFEEVRLTVAADDDRARTFYEENGFEQIDRLADNFESGDGLLLAKDL